MIIKSVTETIFQDLRVKIIEGALAPGSKLKEKELSSNYGISRAPLREAFGLLENEHLVSYRHYVRGEWIYESQGISD